MKIGYRMLRYLTMIAALATLTLTANAQQAKSIFRYVPTPNIPGQLSDDTLRAASASSPNDIWAVGWTAIHFNGKEWKDFPAPGATGGDSWFLSGVYTVSPTLAWAGGGRDDQGQILDKWDGKKWERIPGLPFQPSWDPWVMTITGTAADDVWVAGTVQPPNNFCVFFEHWNGQKWTADPNSICEEGASAWLDGASQDAKNDIWYVGLQWYEDAEVPLAIHFDGITGTVQTLPSSEAWGNLNGVVALSPHNVWAVGWQNTTDYDYTNSTLIMHYDGNSWTIVPSPNRENQGSTLEGVVANSPDDLYAFGFSRTPNGNEYTLVEHWDGKEWTIIPSPDPHHNPNVTEDVLFTGVVPSPGNVWLFGYQFTAPNLPCCLASLALHATTGD